MLLSCVFLTCSSAHSQNCDAILWQGIHDEFRYNNESQLQADISKVLTMNREQREEYLKKNEGNISLGLLKILDLSLLWDNKDEGNKALKEYIKLEENFAWKSSEYTDFRLKLVNEKIVRAWKNCVDQAGISISAVGDPAQSFILNIRYNPKDDEVKDVKITSMNIVGGHFSEVGTLKPGALLKRFGGLSEIVNREGMEALGVVVEIDGRPSVTYSLEKITPEPEQIDTAITKSIDAFGGWKHLGGDRDMNTNSNDRVPVRCSSALVLQGERKVVLKVTFHCEEHGGDHTRFGSTREFLVYEAQQGQRILSGSAKGGLECSMTGGTVGRNHGYNSFSRPELDSSFWKTLRFRVDSKRSDDSDAVGVGGDLEFKVVTVAD